MSLFTFKATNHPTTPAKLGTPVNSGVMERLMDQLGPIEIKTIAADWEANLSGLLNLNDPKAVQAGLKERREPIKIFAHVIRHPSQGFFLVDTGVSRRFVSDPKEVGVGWVLRKYAGISDMKAQQSTKEIIDAEGTALKGVFMTHLHLDHVSGLPDIPKDVPIYIGPHEADSGLFMNVAVQGTNDRLLAGRPPLQEFEIPRDADERFEGVIDIFGDGTLFAIHSPGHTTGHIALVARTPAGPVLMTGDVCHTRWGWDNCVEPGTYLKERDPSRKSLFALKALSERHPNMEIKLGHQF
ncbi:metallo-beta-lactamase superfamily domain-containing protein [Fusarium denticulatum]|uniref:Metallo-beta-lactamase superfamily domain-containing protein n=1 Tax=Fusarium denticulatum TaxID=48507 RepID=A0A8H5XFP2_9HYPO|nr:metallo-beta-lactamase superfamily domain-containing protein [Fusarium denticulatum]